MCGYVGLFYKNSKQCVESKTIEKCLQSIQHRGPDDSDIQYFNKAILGFQRLSIIDLENGSQPYSKNQYTIVFNGEIYNYQEIREGLIQKGYSFETQSDTEVLLTSYIEYGNDCVHYLRGMYSFMIWDNQYERMFGAIDHFSIKPLYYIDTEDYIAFSSEYKALLPLLKTKTVDKEALQNYLSFQFVPLNKTMLKEVKKVPAGHYFTFKNEKLNFNQYFQISYQQQPTDKEDIYRVMRDSVKKHMIADEEVGVFLSGGIDSTIIATLASQINPKIKSFTVGFDIEGYNEMDIAKETAKTLNIENYSHIITQKEYIESLSNVVMKMDDPVADPSAIGVYFLSQKASEYVKVVLSGEGSDELFGGYNIYKEYYSLHPFSCLPNLIKKGLYPIVKYLPNIKGKNYLLRAITPLKSRYIGNAKIFKNQELKQIMKDINPNNTYQGILSSLYNDCKNEHYDYVTTMQYIDMHTWLQGDILMKGDKMSMANSLELRVPFLDKEVMTIASRLSLKQKVNRKSTKVLLREAFCNIIPSHVVNRKKLGFPTPIRVWLKSDLGEVVKNTIQKADVDEYIHKDYVLHLLDEHQRGINDHSRKVWTIFIFCLWHQLVVEDI